MALAEICYRITAEFPREEIYGMTAQIRRAAVSIPANVAEGHGRESTGTFIQSLRVVQGSLKELETHLLITERVGIANSELVQPILSECDEIGRMLRAMIRSLQGKETGGE
jgi:four helix bundle protein